MKKFIILIITLAISVLSLCSCSDGKPHADGLSIVCTTFPQYDFIKNILGSDDRLTLLLDDGADLHSYEPTAHDIITIGSADLFVYVGGVSDVWVENTVKAANNPELKAVALMDLVDTLEEEYVVGMQQETHEHIHNEAHSGDHSTEDEHIWLSIKNAAKITQALCNIICEIDSEKSELYRINTESYVAKLNALNKEYQSVIDSASRKTVLFADRFPFRYLTEDYGLTYFAAFAGCSSESEASFETMAFLIDKTKELNLPVILTIEGSDGSLAKTVCDSSGAKTAVLDSCQSVSADDIKNGTTYTGIMMKNLEVLREALN